MKVEIKQQEVYSRGELLLRGFFAWLYIQVPHGIVLWALGTAASFIRFITFWAIMFTGEHPKGFYEFQLMVMRWRLRVTARLWDMRDGYPPFDTEADDAGIELDAPYPETLSRPHQLLKFFFGSLYCGLPHGFCLIFRYLASAFVRFLAFWSILFTGNYPSSWFEFNLGTLRWSKRVQLYLTYITDDYPPFSGKRRDNEVFDSSATASTSADLGIPPRT